jgi:membrane protease YdiL (CAAX protease family)
MIESSQPSNLLPDSEPDSQRELQFSPILTAFCLMVCVWGFAWFQWNASSPQVDHELVNVSRDLERIANRLLSFESRLSELPAFEQAMFRLWGEDGDTQQQLRLWYAELNQEGRNPLDELYVGILDGEADLRTDLMASMQMWDSELPPFPTFRRLLDVVYLGSDSIGPDYDILQAQLAEEVPANWFYFQLAKRLASRSGDASLRDHLHRQFQQLTDPQLWKWRGLVIFELGIGGIGLICLVYVVGMRFQNRMFLGAGSFNQRPTPWSFKEGLAVLARGGALSIFLIVLLAVLPYGVTILEGYGSFLLSLPTVLLASVWLCRSKNPSFLEVLGCKNLFQRFRSSLPILMSVIALGLIGDWLIILGGAAFEISVHWTEWFVPQLVWGSQAESLKIAIEVVVLAPIFEELIFRGIVFSTLRTKFGFTASMIGSATVFALAHGYGPIAFLAVFWSGLLWAWLYERTGSVIPGMCAHAVNNGLVVYFLVALFR